MDKSRVESTIFFIEKNIIFYENFLWSSYGQLSEVLKYDMLVIVNRIYRYDDERETSVLMRDNST